MADPPDARKLGARPEGQERLSTRQEPLVDSPLAHGLSACGCYYHYWDRHRYRYRFRYRWYRSVGRRPSQSTHRMDHVYGAWGGAWT